MQTERHRFMAIYPIVGYDVHTSNRPMGLPMGLPIIETATLAEIVMCGDCKEFLSMDVMPAPPPSVMRWWKHVWWRGDKDPLKR